MISSTLKTYVIALCALTATAAPQIQERDLVRRQGLVYYPLADQGALNEAFCTAGESNTGLLGTSPPTALVSDCEAVYQFFKTRKGHHKLSGFKDKVGGWTTVYEQGTCRFAIKPATGRTEDQTGAEFFVGNEDAANMVRFAIDKYSTKVGDGSMRVNGAGAMACDKAGAKSNVKWGLNGKYEGPPPQACESQPGGCTAEQAY